MPAPVPIFRGKVDETGKLKLSNAKEFARYLLTLKDKDVELTVKAWSQRRSDAENRYYWGVVVEILANEFGYLPDEMHEILKAKFLRRWATGKVGAFPFAGSTATLQTKAFQEYLETIRTWALSEHHINIPLPGEVDITEE